MADASPWRTDLDEPLGLWSEPTAPPPDHPDLRALAFELSSGGDRVPGRLLLPPAGDGPFPLILLQHGAGGSKEAPYLDATGGPWARGGAAVASIDFPLHGRRGNPKLGSLLLDALSRGDATDARAWELALGFVRQSVMDLRRTLDASAQLPQIDPKRVAYASFSLGSIVGSIFCAVDPRPCAAALALGGGGVGPAAVDPARWIGRFAPRPLLFVNARADQTMPRAATESLFAAAGEPKQLLWFDGGHDGLPGRALKEMWRFLCLHLGLGVPA